jgi:hydroxyacylglutathione hydrolase
MRKLATRAGSATRTNGSWQEPKAIIAARGDQFIFPPSEIHWQTIISEPFAENTYVAHLVGRTECVIVDPGLQPRLIVEYVEQAQLAPAAFLITHAHADHIGGNAALKRRWPNCPIVIGRLEAPALTDPWLNLSGQFGLPVTSPEADVFLDDGEVYEVAGFRFVVRLIPGHAPGHIVFIWEGARPIHVFGGDVLFAGSIGRTDFPGGSFEALRAGIEQHLFTLPDDTIVLPGHGPATTTGVEKQTNPFVGRGGP